MGIDLGLLVTITDEPPVLHEHTFRSNLYGMENNLGIPRIPSEIRGDEVGRRIKEIEFSSLT